MAFVGTHRALLSSSIPGWAKGFDSWYDYTVPRGTPLLGFPPATDTHSSSIYALTSSLNYQSFAANVPTRTNLGLQTVPTRTNLCFYSTDYSNANWVTTFSSKTTGQADFIGGTGAALITADGSSNVHFISGNNSSSISYTSATTYTFSRFVKAGTQSLLQLTAPSPAFGTGQYANFSLSGAGSVTASLGLVSSGIQALANNWYRIWIVVTATSTASSTSGSIIFIASGADGRAPTNTLATNFTDFGGQVEVGTFPSPLIVTAGTSATVNGNQQVIGLTGLLGSGVSGFVQVNMLQPDPGANVGILNIYDGTQNNRMLLLWQTGSNQLVMSSTAASVAGTNVTESGGFTSGVATIAFAFGPGYMNFRRVGKAANTAQTGNTFPTGMNVSSLMGRGSDAGANSYGRTQKLAFKFGPANQASLDAAFAAAQLAAASP